MIDSHQHFWKYNPVRDSWITQEMKMLKNDFLPEHLAPTLIQHKIDGCVAVQADQSETETEFLLGLSTKNSFIRGVVGWVDLCSDNIKERLDYFEHFKNLKGFRHIVQAEPKGFMQQKKFLFGISQLEKYRFTYDILIYHHQVEEAIGFLKHFPNQKFVVDHLAKPDIKQNAFYDWSKKIKELAAFENVSCKLSGFSTEADWANWRQEEVMPYLDFALAEFGTARLMYGSDWPVCLLATTYEKQLDLVEKFTTQLSNSEKQNVMCENAVHFYNL